MAVLRQQTVKKESCKFTVEGCKLTAHYRQPQLSVDIFFFFFYSKYIVGGHQESAYESQQL